MLYLTCQIQSLQDSETNVIGWQICWRLASDGAFVWLGGRGRCVGCCRI